MEFKIKEIVEATKGELIRGNPETIIKGISTDSRALQKNELFVALYGENFDGHNFIGQVKEKGGIGAIISHPVEQELPIIIKVEDSLRAYGDIASAYRNRFDIPIVGITGSNGKTTTKNMTSSILSERFCVLSPEKSFNNQIGVPATLLQLNNQHDVAVLELGTNMPGEIKRLTQIARPNIGVITNIGATHLEKLKSIKGVAEEKGDLLKDVEFAVLNADDDYFDRLAEKVNGQIVAFGVKRKIKNTTYNISASDISLTDDNRPKFNLFFDEISVCEIKLPCLGEYNVYNSLAAAAVGKIMGLNSEEIKVGLENYKPAEMRMQKFFRNGITIINDAYNSNPRSLSSALEFFDRLHCRGKKIAVLADMLELGEDSAQLHRQIGEKIPPSIDVLITVGDYAKLFAESAEKMVPNIHSLSSNLEASKLLNNIFEEGDAILLKGSRGMKLEEVLENWDGMHTKSR